MKPREAGATLNVKLRIGDERIKLAQLKELSTQLQRALSAVASDLADSTTPGIEFEIVAAGVGSLSLALTAVAEEGSNIDPEKVLSTFTEDLAHIRRQSYRPDLTAGLTKHYRVLVTCLGSVGAVVEYGHGPDLVVVDESFRKGFEVALKERVAEDVSVVGYLDAINAHRAPYTFYLYPKLEDIDRVECRFPARMLESVAGLLKQTVKVEGTGHFAPVGIYPLRIEVAHEPRSLAWDPGVLRTLVGSLALVPDGMSASDYLQRNREAAGLAD